MTLAQKLAQLRKKQGMSQDDSCDKELCHVSSSWRNYIGPWNGMVSSDR